MGVRQRSRRGGLGEVLYPNEECPQWEALSGRFSKLGLISLFILPLLPRYVVKVSLLLLCTSLSSRIVSSLLNPVLRRFGTSLDCTQKFLVHND